MQSESKGERDNSNWGDDATNNKRLKRRKDKKNRKGEENNREKRLKANRRRRKKRENLLSPQLSKSSLSEPTSDQESSPDSDYSDVRIMGSIKRNRGKTDC